MALLKFYLPSLLLDYLDEGPEFPYDEYEYLILFGYLREIRRIKRSSLDWLGYDTSLIRQPGIVKGGVPVPPFIKGVNVTGIDLCLEWYGIDYDARVDRSGTYHHPSHYELIPQMVAYLTTYDHKFHWREITSKLCDGLDLTGPGLVAAARAAASIGNLPLAREIVDIRLICNSHNSDQVLQAVLVASIDVNFSRRLRALYRRLRDTDWNWTEADCVAEEIIRYDKLEMFQELLFMQKPVINWMSIARERGAVRIMEFLEAQDKVRRGCLED